MTDKILGRGFSYLTGGLGGAILMAAAIHNKLVVLALFAYLGGLVFWMWADKYGLEELDD